MASSAYDQLRRRARRRSRPRSRSRSRCRSSSCRCRGGRRPRRPRRRSRSRRRRCRTGPRWRSPRPSRPRCGRRRRRGSSSRSSARCRRARCSWPGGVLVAGLVGGAHVEGVAAVGEARVALRAGAGAPGAAVDAALEGRAALARVEREARRGRAGRVRRDVSIVVCGAVVSIVNVRLDGVSTWPPTSVARRTAGSPPASAGGKRTINRCPRGSRRSRPRTRWRIRCRSSSRRHPGGSRRGRSGPRSRCPRVRRSRSCRNRRSRPPRRTWRKPRGRRSWSSGRAVDTPVPDRGRRGLLGDVGGHGATSEAVGHRRRIEGGGVGGGGVGRAHVRPRVRAGRGALNCTWATADRIGGGRGEVMPASGVPGSVRMTEGAASSTSKATWCPMLRPEVTVEVLAPVAPAVACAIESVAAATPPEAEPLPRSSLLPGRTPSPPDPRRTQGRARRSRRSSRTERTVVEFATCVVPGVDVDGARSIDAVEGAHAPGRRRARERPLVEAGSSRRRSGSRWPGG